MSEPVCGVYSATHIASGRSYIGKSVDVSRRWNQHIWEAERGEGYALHNALRKYGPDAFRFEVLEVCDTEPDACAAEEYWIEWYGTMSPRGFNLTAGGDGGAPSPEACEKIRRKLMGHAVSEETRRKIGEKGRGRRHTDEARKKIGDIWRGKKRGARSPETVEKLRAAQTGKRLSAEVRQRMSEAQTARWAKQKAGQQ